LYASKYPSKRDSQTTAHGEELFQNGAQGKSYHVLDDSGIENIMYPPESAWHCSAMGFGNDY